MADDAPKMKSGTFTVRNTAPGPRGFYDAETGFATLDAGQSVSGVRFTEGEYKSASTIAGLEITAGDAPAADTDAQEAVGAKAYDEITAKDIKAALDEKGVTYEANADKKVLYDLYAASFDQAPVTPPVVPSPTDELDKASDSDLRDIAVALLGADKVPEGADRETLLKLARGEPTE
jgi:hypothetical protein